MQKVEGSNPFSRFAKDLHEQVDNLPTMAPVPPV
jgi:hypothetical protein